MVAKQKKSPIFSISFVNVMTKIMDIVDFLFYQENGVNQITLKVLNLEIITEIGNVASVCNV